MAARRGARLGQPTLLIFGDVFSEHPFESIFCVNLALIKLFGVLLKGNQFVFSKGPYKCPENQHFGHFSDIPISGYINKRGKN